MNKNHEMDIYLINSLGQITRTYKWSDPEIHVVFLKSSKRVELFANLEDLKSEKTEYNTLAKTTIDQLKKSPVRLEQIGELRVDVFSDSEISPSVYGEPENETLFQSWLKKSAISHIAFLALLLIFTWTYNKYLKPERTTVTVQPTLIKTIPVAKKRAVPQKRKVVKASTKKIKKHKVTRKVVKKSIKRRTTRSKAVAQQKVKYRPKKVARKDVHSMGALGALGGVRGGRSGGKGLNLNSLNNYAGSGSGSGVKSKGLSSPGLQGKGLIAQSAGNGRTVRDQYGYGTKGKAGGAANYGKHSIAGSSGSYYYPLQELGQVVGGLEKSQIAAVINRNIGQVIYCYEKGLQKQPNLSGRVAIEFVIAGNGRVSEANVSRSSLQHNKVESCITNKLKAWRFPKPQGNVDVNVTYPFILKRMSQG
ncbi:MAG: energy transducer TonB [Bdellovibrionales bacterium]|nr:energy transducer TonB [Bdellovibrionales bacterium]